MKNTRLANITLYLFFIALVVNLWSNLNNNHKIANYSKWFILSALLLHYCVSVKKVRYKILAALLFSWIGDVLLIFQDEADGFFIFGLASFLIAHLCYSWFFFGFAKKAKLNFTFLATILIYLISFLCLLWPKLYDLKIPVVIYASVISVMLIIVFHTKEKLQHYSYAIIGAILFVLSDSILAINKFHTPFSLSGFLIMLTYGLAQYALVKVAINNAK